MRVKWDSPAAEVFNAATGEILFRGALGFATGYIQALGESLIRDRTKGYRETFRLQDIKLRAIESNES